VAARAGRVATVLPLLMVCLPVPRGSEPPVWGGTLWVPKTRSRAIDRKRDSPAAASKPRLHAEPRVGNSGRDEAMPFQLLPVTFAKSCPCVADLLPGF
jgi:hypothetical protein